MMRSGRGVVYGVIGKETFLPLGNWNNEIKSVTHLAIWSLLQSGLLGHFSTSHSPLA